jgi:hypothetical protein
MEPEIAEKYPWIGRDICQPISFYEFYYWIAWNLGDDFDLYIDDLDRIMNQLYEIYLNGTYFPRSMLGFDGRPWQ